MTSRDLLVRLAGAGLMAAGCGASLWLRALMLGIPHDPTMLECALVLASFVLALGGAVLVFNGERLIGWRRTAAPDRQSPSPSDDGRNILGRLLARRSGRPLE